MASSEKFLSSAEFKWSIPQTSILASNLLLSILLYKVQFNFSNLSNKKSNSPCCIWSIVWLNVKCSSLWLMCYNDEGKTSLFVTEEKAAVTIKKPISVCMLSSSVSWLAQYKHSLSCQTSNNIFVFNDGCYWREIEAIEQDSSYIH